MPNQRVNIKQLTVGFTLIELMITLSVMAIVATVGVPSFMSIIASNRVTAASNGMVTALNLAKSDAIRSGQNSVLCKSKDAATCDAKLNWSDGWLLFNDTNGDQKKDTDERIIRSHAATDPSLSFIFRGGDFVEFRPNGSTNESGRFCFRNTYKDNNSRVVRITHAGRIRTEAATGSNEDCKT